MALKVNISWVDSNPTTHLDHFEIWRKTASGGTFGKISTDIGLGVGSWEDVNGGIGLVDGVEYFYQVRAYNADGQYSLIEDSILVSEKVLLFEDDFAGTTVDTLKWDVTNINSGLIDLSQNNEFIFYCNNSGALTNIGDDSLISVNGFNMLSGIRVFTFDINSNSQNDSSWYFGIADSTEPLSSTNNRITIGRSAVAGDLQLRTRIGGVNTDVEPTFDLSTTTTVKIIIDGSAVTFSYWTGSAWSVWTTNTEFTTANSWNIAGVYRTATGIGSSIGDQFTIDNMSVADADFSTQYPI